VSLPDECHLCCAEKPADSGDELCTECREMIDRCADLAIQAMEEMEDADVVVD